MASINILSGPASILVPNKDLSSQTLSGLDLHPFASRAPSMKTLPTKSSLVVRAQQGGSPKEIKPSLVEHVHKKVALVDTSPYVRTPWNTSEDQHEIRMWFDMPGLGADNIEVNVVDDLLVVKGDGGIDAFGNKVFSPHETTVHLPFNSWKEEITAVFKNGVLYITVPKILKFEHKIIHVPVRSII